MIDFVRRLRIAIRIAKYLGTREEGIERYPEVLLTMGVHRCKHGLATRVVTHGLRIEPKVCPCFLGMMFNNFHRVIGDHENDIIESAMVEHRGKFPNGCEGPSCDLG